MSSNTSTPKKSGSRRRPKKNLFEEWLYYSSLINEKPEFSRRRSSKSPSAIRRDLFNMEVISQRSEARRSDRTSEASPSSSKSCDNLRHHRRLERKKSSKRVYFEELPDEHDKNVKMQPGESSRTEEDTAGKKMFSYTESSSSFTSEYSAFELRKDGSVVETNRSFDFELTRKSSFGSESNVPVVQATSPQKLVDISFLWGHTKACEVYLSGSFNGWSTSFPMQRNSDVFSVDVSLPPGKHLYKFIVDGCWYFDITKTWEHDLDGNVNNVIHTF